jgi:hypothetical protein
METKEDHQRRLIKASWAVTVEVHWNPHFIPTDHLEFQTIMLTSKHPSTIADIQVPPTYNRNISMPIRMILFPSNNYHVWNR